MTPTHEYKLITALTAQFMDYLTPEASQGWKPILMSTSAERGGTMIHAVLERALKS
jgi:hypothetical protein